MRMLTAITAIAAATPFAAAQQGWVLETDRSVLTPSRPTARITLSATHALEDWAFVEGRLHLLAPVDLVSMVNFDHPVTGGLCPRPPCHTWLEWGYDLKVGQLHNPPASPADPSSPLVVASFDLNRIGPGAETVILDTETVFFRVAPFQLEPISELRVAQETSLEIALTDCEADCDADGELTFFDFLCFQEVFAAADGYADCDGSGQIDFFDFLCFQSDFAAGCP
jgi:hypothetical protein